MGRSKSRRIRFCGAVFPPLFGLAFQGCVSWTGQELSDLPQTDRIRIENQSGERMEILRPHLEGDSVLVGLMVNGTERFEEQAAVPIRIPLSEIVKVERKGLNAPATFTVLGILGVAAFVVLLAFLIPST